VKMVPLAVLQQFIADQEKQWGNACGQEACALCVVEDLKDLVVAEAIGGRDVW
jgi:hypothetical protein